MLPSMKAGDGLIISVGEARKLLGHKSKNLTNEELILLIKDTETVVRIAINKCIRSKNNQNSDIMKPEKVIKL